MSLSEYDEYRLAELFEKKESCPATSDEYFKYRDEIFTHVLAHLDDYFKVLKYQWNAKFKIREEDAISIIHDGLLAAVNNFKSGYQSHNRVTKFLTYLVHILKNNVKNYVTLNYVGAKRSKRNFHKIPLNAYMSLEHLTTHSHNDDDLNNHPFLDKKYDPILKHLSSKFEYFDSQQNRDFFVEHMLNKLQESDQKIIKAILRGDNLKEVAASVNMTTAGIKYRMKRLIKKFALIETELCR